MSEEPQQDAPGEAAVAVPLVGEIDPEQPVLGPRCTWCSALLATGDETTCPTCGAILVGAESEIPGLTSVDPANRFRQRPVIQPRGIIGWLNQDVPIEEHPEIPEIREALEPPPTDVKIEMLRLQLEADRQQLLQEIEATPETIAAGIHSPSPLFSDLPAAQVDVAEAADSSDVVDGGPAPDGDQGAALDGEDDAAADAASAAGEGPSSGASA